MPAAPVITAIAAVASAATAYSSMQKQESASKKSQNLAEKNAQAAEEATNKADRKSPDTAAIMSAAEQAGKAGASSTMLTGPSGVDPSALTLGKSTLLGS